MSFFAKPLHMKSFWNFVILAVIIPSVFEKKVNRPVIQSRLPRTENLIIVTTDGLRWQEVFAGADSLIINSERDTPDTSTMKMLYWASSPQERREKLMPFFWNVVAHRGQVYGNRYYENKVNVANAYSISYPGYNELFTGNTDISISSNRKRRNPNINILEYLNNKPAFAGKVAAFSSWDVFPYILNEERNKLPVNSGYELMDASSGNQKMINAVQEKAVCDKAATRYDELTFLTAKEYLQQHKPKVLFLGLGETDEFAHEGRYDLYLQQAAKVDRMLAELWHLVQTIPGYKNNTTIIITTDHGRGRKPGTWTKHGEFISGSSQVWFAIMGPGINPAGEIKADEQHYLQQMAQTFAQVVGEDFSLSANAPAVVIH